jgi:thiol-disulfide isomerase/thioredoxin
VSADEESTQSVWDSRSHAERGNERSRRDEGGGSTWALIALLVLAAAALMAIQLRRPSASADPLVGQPLPPLDAAGWLNTARPLSADDVRGKIVVIDFWATWCEFCAIGLPKLVDLHERYQGQGVMLVGLTKEPASMLGQIRRFNQRVEGVDWPIGYGAWMAVEALEIDAWPTYIIYDRSGVSVWAGHSVDELEDAVVALLAKES